MTDVKNLTIEEGKQTCSQCDHERSWHVDDGVCVAVVLKTIGGEEDCPCSRFKPES